MAPTPNGVNLSGLTNSLREDLCQAARMLDVEATEQAIGRVREIDATLADKLEELVHTYRYDWIIAICDGS